MGSVVRLGVFLLCGVLMSAVAVPVSAQQAEGPDSAAGGQENTRYVRDILYIAVREGPSEQAEVVEVIPSGTGMVILEQAPDSGFAHVRLESGEEGWVLTRFLTEEPIARQRLEATQERIERLEEENGRLQRDLAAVREERDELSERAAGLQRRSEDLAEELERVRAISAESVALDQENRRLSAELEIARNGRREAEQEADAARQRLYTIAGIAALLGLAVGFYIGYTPVRREKKWRQLP